MGEGNTFVVTFLLVQKSNQKSTPEKKITALFPDGSLIWHLYYCSFSKSSLIFSALNHVNLKNHGSDNFAMPNCVQQINLEEILFGFALLYCLLSMGEEERWWGLFADVFAFFNCSNIFAEAFKKAT